jgi:hypothetical protein
MACACGNPNGAGVGCANTGSSGALLSSTGVASVAADATDPGSVVLAGSSMLSGSTCIFLQGDALLAAGAPFGAGVRCTAGQLFRLKVSGISGGNASYPVGADRSITNRSSDLGTPIGSGATRWYQTYYRDPSLPNPGSGCPTNATFNITSGQRITWGP